MNTEKNQIEIEENQPVDKSRRRAIGAGIAAPIIMTLASKPVFAIQSMSNVGSMVGSKAERGNCFNGGYSHGRWKTLNHPEEWVKATGSEPQKIITPKTVDVVVPKYYDKKTKKWVPETTTQKTVDEISYTGMTVGQAFGSHTIPGDTTK
ncbi:MAG: hypothetical protein WBI40_12550, partial [Methylococcaceae bacterium]